MHTLRIHIFHELLYIPCVQGKTGRNDIIPTLNRLEWEEPLASELMLRPIEAIMRPVIYLSSAKRAIAEGKYGKRKNYQK